jgi:hypothetical protein
MQKSTAFHGFPFWEMLTEIRITAVYWRMTRAYSSYLLRLCLPAALALPIDKNEKFGTFSF